MPTRNLPTLGAQFPPAYHRPFLRYFDGDQGAVVVISGSPRTLR